jgi:L-iditol 2-dehydrogenase
LLHRTNFDPGGFSEYLRLPAINVEGGVYPLPDEVSLEEATFIEPLACVVRGQRLAGMGLGKGVLVVGCGVAGLLHIQVAKIHGASCIIGVDPCKNRLRWAEKFGADIGLSPDDDLEEALREKNKGFLADLVVICTTSRDGFIKGLNLIERGGVGLLFAPTMEAETIPISVNELFWRRELTLISSYAGGRMDHLMALDLIRTRKVKVRELITHRLPLEKIGEGFRLVEEATNCLKVIIEPQR